MSLLYYKLLTHLLSTVLFSHKEEDISVIKDNILATNQNKAPSHSVGSYEVLELLGSGAFGSVYKVPNKFILALPRSAPSIQEQFIYS